MAYTSEDVRHGSPIFDKCMRSGFNDVVVSCGLQPGRCLCSMRHAEAGWGTAQRACCRCSGVQQLMRIAAGTALLSPAAPLLQHSQVSTSSN